MLAEFFTHARAQSLIPTSPSTPLVARDLMRNARGKKEEWRERLRDAGMKPIRDAEEVSAKKDEEEMGEERWTGVHW